MSSKQVRWALPSPASRRLVKQAHSSSLRFVRAIGPARLAWTAAAGAVILVRLLAVRLAALRTAKLFLGGVCATGKPSSLKGAGSRFHRPGPDPDARMEQLPDDPRRLPGAEAGKAEKAAMGVQGLNGRNTVSFDPADTLVRPAVRLQYGLAHDRYARPLKPDDVVVVPEFFCGKDAHYVFEQLLQEMRSLEGTSVVRLDELPLCQRAAYSVCDYFSISDTGLGLRVYWDRGTSSQDPLARTWGSFGSRPTAGQNCLATLSFGDSREVACRGNHTHETINIQAANGSLTLLGRDVCLRWQHGMLRSPLSHDESGHTADGSISISVMGISAEVVEEIELAPSPSDVPIGDALSNGGAVTFERQEVTSARPSMRIIVAPPGTEYHAPVSHDDVVIVPNALCQEDDWTLYYQMIKEMRELQAEGQRRSEWVSWHEGAHLISQNPAGSRTYQDVLERVRRQFDIAPGHCGTRFNWYRDGSDWKPFHHDSAAFNAQRASEQNCTVGVSFGAGRELAFRHARTGELIYFPQRNGMLFFFGRDVNIRWQHGLNALPAEQQGSEGRVSVIVWGLCTLAFEEPGSPPMLSDESRAKGGGKGSAKGGGKGVKGSTAGKYRQDPCRNFRAGLCSFGERCRFKHDAAPGQTGR